MERFPITFVGPSNNIDAASTPESASGAEAFSVIRLNCSASYTAAGLLSAGLVSLLCSIGT